MDWRNSFSWLVAVFKVAAPLGIVAWVALHVHGQNPDAWGQLTAGQWRYEPLALAFLLALSAVCLTFVRWFWLVQAVGLPFSLADAFRLGSVGYVLNFISLGSVGGDLFKALMLAHERPGHRAEALASVVADRVVGLFGLLLIASAALGWGTAAVASVEVQTLAQVVFAATLVATVALGTLLYPGVAELGLWRWMAELPWVGGLVERLVAALRAYQRRWDVLGLSLGLSLLSHLANVLALYLAAVGLFNLTPSLWDHLAIVPVAMVAGSVPLAPAGLGAFEAANEVLYQTVAGPQHTGQGLLVALAYRAITIAVAGLAAMFYVACREEVQEVLAEEEAQRELAQTAREPSVAMVVESTGER